MAYTLHLERLDSVPLEGNPLTFELRQWLTTLVDNLNTTISTIEGLLVGPVVFGGTSTTVALNSFNISSNAAQTTFTLPSVAPVGSIVTIVGAGAGGWVLKPAAGQTIKVIANTANVSITSTGQYQTISVVCIEENTTWESFSSQTTGFTIV